MSHVHAAPFHAHTTSNLPPPPLVFFAGWKAPAAAGVQRKRLATVFPIGGQAANRHTGKVNIATMLFVHGKSQAFALLLLTIIHTLLAFQTEPCYLNALSDGTLVATPTRLYQWTGFQSLRYI